MNFSRYLEEARGNKPKQIEPLSNRELQLLAEQAPESWSGTRNRLIMRHMLYTGSRVGETVELDWIDVNLEKGYINISPAKWYGERRLHISLGWTARLQEWKNNPDSPESKWVFPNASGGNLSTRYIRYFVEDYAVNAGMSSDRVHPHLFRHTFASRLLASSGNLRTVQNALGHNDLKTTMVYLHTLDEDQLEQIKSRGNVNLAEFEKTLPNVEATASERS